MTTVTPVNQRASAPAVRVNSMDDDRPGAFQFYSVGGETEAGILFNCPCGCGSMFSAAIKEYEGAGPVWGWDGNRDCPTLSPSLLVYQCNDRGERIGEHWHGFLTDGVFRSC